jgi:hypothetical protein
MERRDFLKASAVCGAAVASAGASGGCAAVGADAAMPGASPTPFGDMDGFLAGLDKMLEEIAKGRPLKSLVASPEKLTSADPDSPFRTPRGEQLFRKSLSSLYLVASFRDLPEEQRLHPGMQARMWRAMGDMDEAVFGTAQMLEELKPSERLALQKRLKDDPDLAMRIGEELDKSATEAGMSPERRLNIRTLSSHISWRLKNQSASVICDEYVGKVRKVAARRGLTEETQRKIAAGAMSSGALWEEQARLAESRFNPISKGLFGSQLPPPPAPPPGTATAAQPAAPAATTTAPTAAQPAPSAAPQPAPTHAPHPYKSPDYSSASRPPPRYPTDEESESNDKPGSTAITVGGVLLGLSLVVGLVGLAIAAESSSVGGGIMGAFVVTAAALLLLGGLITLIVGLAIRAGS